MPKNYNTPETPHTDAFRRWLADALTVTGLKPATVAKEIGASVNSVGVFLRDPERDITLGRAADLERFLRKKAAEVGTDLPTVRAALTAAGGA